LGRKFVRGGLLLGRPVLALVFDDCAMLKMAKCYMRHFVEQGKQHLVKPLPSPRQANDRRAVEYKRGTIELA
jgi:hypothetical protein